MSHVKESSSYLFWIYRRLNILTALCSALLSIVLLSLAPLAHAGTPAATTTPSRVALIIANAQYVAVQKLNNPIADSRLVASALTAVGFTSVTLVQNGTRAEMERALRTFSVLADKADVALIYYAGHGMEMNGTNYLVPVDALMARDRDVDTEAVKLDTLLDMSQGAKRLRIIILDACRNNPFDSTMQRAGGKRAVSRGLAPVEPTGESLVVYAAKAGRTAADGSAQNSPFARALARRLIEPGREVNLLFRKVRDDVLAETGGEQEPFTYGSLSSQEFYFRPPAAAAASVGGNDLEAAAWDLCSRGTTAAPCRRYQERYAKGRYAGLVADRLGDLAQPAALVTPAAAVAPAPAVGGLPELIPRLGIIVQREVTPAQGIRIQTVQPNTPAQGRLFGGDLIIRINGEAVDLTRGASEVLAEALSDKAAIRLTVQRGVSQTTAILRP